jgi:hypothetical protein
MDYADLINEAFNRGEIGIQCPICGVDCYVDDDPKHKCDPEILADFLKWDNDTKKSKPPDGEAILLKT